MNKKKLNVALLLIVIGFFFMTFKEPRFERLNFFPFWLSGFSLFISVILFEKDIPEMKLLKPLCIINGLLDFFVWLVSLLNLNMPFQIYLPQLLSSVISLYINYQLITNLIQFAENHNYSNTKKLARIRFVRTLYITLFTLFLPIYNTFQRGLFTSLVELFGWFTVLFSVSYLNEFRKNFFSYQTSVERFLDSPKG